MFSTFYNVYQVAVFQVLFCKTIARKAEKHILIMIACGWPCVFVLTCVIMVVVGLTFCNALVQSVCGSGVNTIANALRIWEG